MRRRDQMMDRSYGTKFNESAIRGLFLQYDVTMLELNTTNKREWILLWLSVGCYGCHVEEELSPAQMKYEWWVCELFVLLRIRACITWTRSLDCTIVIEQLDYVLVVLCVIQSRHLRMNRTEGHIVLFVCIMYVSKNDFSMS